MILSSLLSAGAFTLAAQAFVFPEANSLREADSHPHVFNLDCSSCPYALNSQRNGGHEWTTNIKSDLEMKFAAEDNSLKFNGVAFYPIQNPTLPPTLYVSQKKKEGEASTMEAYEGMLRLSYSMEYDEKKVEDNSIVVILMTIMGLDGEMVKVDNVEIRAIKEADGKLTILLIDTIASSPDSPDARCESILCRVFAKLITGVNKAKASAKGAAHKMKCLCVKCFHKLTGHKHHHKGHKGGMAKHGGAPHRRPDGTMELPTHIHLKPAGGRPDHGHHHHHKGFLGRMAMVLRTTVKVVFVPILIGVAFGMAASAIGMLVGQAVVFLWMKYRRTPEAAYEPLDTDEKDAPPAYQDVQAPEAVSEKEVDAKA